MVAGASSGEGRPTLQAKAKRAFLTPKFMKGLLNDIKIKLHEHDPTAKLDVILSFVRRYRVVEGHIASNTLKRMVVAR